MPSKPHVQPQSYLVNDPDGYGCTRIESLTPRSPVNLPPVLSSLILSWAALAVLTEMTVSKMLHAESSHITHNAQPEPYSNYTRMYTRMRGPLRRSQERTLRHRPWRLPKWTCDSRLPHNVSGARTSPRRRLARRIPPSFSLPTETLPPSRRPIAGSALAASVKSA